jgi:BirA family biotin operon repressor/biotin-[acetyl-CoA-carboxylase] ligase
LDADGRPVTVLIDNSEPTDEPSISGVIRFVEETGSTNADLLALAIAGAEEGLWIRAGRQTAGRGRQGRSWASDPGNLYASTLVRLRPTDPPAASLALVAGLAVWGAVQVWLDDPGPLQLKWPNDLLLGGAKLAGILLERAGDAVVIGIGVNLAHHPELPDRPATDLAAHSAAPTPEVFAETLADLMSAEVSRWRAEGVVGTRTRWMRHAHPIGTALTARLPDGEALDGLFDGLDPDGALTLRLASGERRVIHAADLFLL